VRYTETRAAFSLSEQQKAINLNKDSVFQKALGGIPSTKLKAKPGLFCLASLL
jgi:hypothetical protein